MLTFGPTAGRLPDMSTPLVVSVVIAAYNAATFLERAIRSVLLQDITDFEIIVVDDASEDNTCALVERLSLEDERIHLRRSSANRGPAVARNVALDAARGEWIAILDADDAYEAGRLRRLVTVGQQLTADIVVDNFRYYDALAGRVGPPAVKCMDTPQLIEFEKFLQRARPLTGEPDWGLLKPVVRTSFVRRHQVHYPTFSRHGEDFLFLFEAFAAGARYVLVPDPGYLYTTRSSGLSRTHIDYAAMQEHTAELLRDPRLQNTPILQRRLRQRIHALSLLPAAAEYARCRREGDYGAMLRLVLSNPQFRSLLLKKMSIRLCR